MENCRSLYAIITKLWHFKVRVKFCVRKRYLFANLVTNIFCISDMWMHLNTTYSSLNIQHSVTYELIVYYKCFTPQGRIYRISEGGVLISGTDSSGGDMKKFLRGCLQQFVSMNRNAYVSSGAGFKNFEDICNFLVETKKKKKVASTFSIDKKCPILLSFSLHHLCVNITYPTNSQP